MVQGGSKNVHDITFLYSNIGLEFCDAHPFFFAFFWMRYRKFYDTLSTFKNINKLKEVFKALGNDPDVIPQDEFDMLEQYTLNVYYQKQFTLHVYYPKQYISNKGLNEVCMLELESNPNVTMRHLPPSKIGLMVHVKRSCDQSGWI